MPEIAWGSRGTPTPYPITDDAREALKEQGIDAPEHLVLYLRSATGRERKKFQALLNKPMAADDQREMVADMLLSRMDEGTDRRLVREVLEDADEVALNQLLYAYVNGVIPDPKPLEAATEGAVARITPSLLSGLAAT